MTKNEFLTQLEEQLKGYVSTQELRESLNYYQEYIEEEIRKGRTEEDIFEDIGSANAVAKSIIDARGHEPEIETIYDEREINGEKKASSSSAKVFHAEGWKSKAIIIGIIVILVMLLVFAFKVFISLLPILIPCAVILFVIKFFTGNR